jgi:hypothetical protein
VESTGRREAATLRPDHVGLNGHSLSLAALRLTRG